MLSSSSLNSSAQGQSLRNTKPKREVKKSSPISASEQLGSLFKIVTRETLSAIKPSSVLEIFEKNSIIKNSSEVTKDPVFLHA